MTISGPKKPPLFGRFLFVAAAIGAACASVLLGYWLYFLGQKPMTDFYAKLGELALQLSIIVIVGALIKVIVDWGASQRERHLERIAKRLDLMRRVRAMHVTVENCRVLMNAHNTPKTYTEQARRLMELRTEVQEICEDIRASADLFAGRVALIQDLESIISYLEENSAEYIRSHDAMDPSAKGDRQTFLTALEQRKMQWVRDFMDEGAKYDSQYGANLSKAKDTMRSEVYGA